MPLELGEVALQLEQMAQGLSWTEKDREERLASLLEAAARVDPASAVRSTEAALDRPYLAAVAEEGLLGSYAPSPPPSDWQVAAVDGSHIDVDRHLPVACFLVNLGGCVLTYGGQPDATFFSQPRLATESADLHLVDPGNPAQEEAVTGALLGLIRTIEELERLAQVASELSPDLPALVLVDGSLVLWGLSGQGYRPFVRDSIIGGRLLPALKRLQETGRRASTFVGRLCLIATKHRGNERHKELFVPPRPALLPHVLRQPPFCLLPLQSVQSAFGPGVVSTPIASGAPFSGVQDQLFGAQGVLRKRPTGVFLLPARG